MTKVQAKVVEQVEVVAIPEECKTVSSKIRYLASKDMKRGDIAKQLGIRYQHVRNVLIQPLKQDK